MNITVVGTGYVGLVVGACLAETGNTVCGADVDEGKISSLRQNVLPIYEPGLEELVTKNQHAGRLEFTTDVATGDVYREHQRRVEPIAQDERKVEQEVREGNIRPIKAEQLFIHLLSLNIFPFLAAPLFKGFLNINDNTYKDLMEERKEEITNMIINYLQIKE